MIKAVIFDLWGTIAYNKNHIGSYIEKINDVIGEVNKEKFDLMRRDWYTSRTSELEFFTNLVKQINIPEAMSEHLVNLWNSQLDNILLFRDSKYILELLKSRNIKLILVSNTTPISNDAIKILNLERFFDLVILSCNEGITKPSPMIYKKILDKFNLKPEEVLAVGDQLNTDIKGAEFYGIKAILVDRENKLSYKNKIAELDEIEFYLIDKPNNSFI